MKNLKPITLLLFLLIGLQSFAQSFTDGIFTTSFGPISWTTETGSEYPNGGIVYGDYKDKGTFIGNFNNNGKEVKGTFFNGSAEGKFVFIAPFGKTFSNQNIKSFSGFWGYNSDNIYSQNAADEWNVTGKTGEKNSIKNVTNVWSGKWNTTDGNMILQQVGNKIEGTYKGVGTVTATYNPSNRLLKGTFLNKQTNKTGFLEFYFEGNSFKGKWGWTAAMTGGNWNGDKHEKNNKELLKATTQTTTTTANNNNVNSSNLKEKYRINITEIYVQAKNLPIAAASQYWSFYGFSGVRVYKVTNAAKEEIKSFGNKGQNFFDKTENSPLNNNSKTPFVFSNTPDFYRDFEINKSDLNNPNVSIEVEFWHHIKVKVAGPNKDYGKVRKTLILGAILNDGVFSVCENCNNSSNVSYKITKL